MKTNKALVWLENDEPVPCPASHQPELQSRIVSVITIDLGRFQVQPFLMIDSTNWGE
jgi:hypothetical protein